MKHIMSRVNRWNLRLTSRLGITLRRYSGAGMMTLLLVAPVVQADETQVSGDFHLSLYEDARDQVSGLELFTKVVDKEVFFGITCTDMSPFPLIQVLLFNDDVLSEGAKLLDVRYQILSGERVLVTSGIGLQGILKPIDTADEYSNKVRLELSSGQVKSMRAMLEKYSKLLSLLTSGDTLKVTLSHRALGSHDYMFSLKGLKSLLSPHQSVCM